MCTGKVQQLWDVSLRTCSLQINLSPQLMTDSIYTSSSSNSTLISRRCVWCELETKGVRALHRNQALGSWFIPRIKSYFVALVGHVCTPSADSACWKGSGRHRQQTHHCKRWLKDKRTWTEGPSDHPSLSHVNIPTQEYFGDNTTTWNEVKPSV